MLKRPRLMLSRLLFLSALAALFTAPLRSQTATPDQNGPTVFKANARNVVLDIVVTGRDGKPVEGLHKEYFEIAEDGRTQTTTYFEEHTGAKAAEISKLPPLPPNVFTNVPRVKPTGAVTLLLLDSMNTQLNDQATVHAQMLKYLKSVPPGTKMAIFVLGTRLRFIQGFTDDPSLLAAALTDPKRGAFTQTSPLLQSSVDKIQDQQQVALQEEINNSPHASVEIAALKQFLAEKDAFPTDQRVQNTLTALQELAYYLAGISGRKNVIWFSSSIPLTLLSNVDLLDPMPVPGLLNPFSTQRDYQQEIHKTSALLAAAQVAIYPVAAEGLNGESVYQAGNGTVPVQQAEKMGAQMLNTIQDDATVRNSNHATMLEIARDTGGVAFINTNGLSDAVAHVVDQGSKFYTLTYTPANSAADGKYRKIQVKLKDVQGSSGYTLAYRRGYYASDGNEIKTAAAKLPTDPLHPFMGPGMPASTQLPILVRVQRDTAQASASKPAGDNTNLKSPVTRYTVDFDIPTSGLELDSADDGSHHGVVEAALVVYDNDGKPLNWIVRTFKLNLDPARYATVQQRGVNLTLEIDVPATGATVRSGILDSNTNRAGTLEIPLSSVVDPVRTSHL